MKKITILTISMLLMGFCFFRDAQAIGQRHIINTSSDLFELADQVNSGNDFAGHIIFLNKDIDLKNTQWIPIGKKIWLDTPDHTTTEDYPFSGTFDGNGHCIKNLKIDSPTFKYNDGYSGLFGYIGENGIVKNVSVYGSISAVDTRNGGISGENKGLVLNCLFSGDIKGDFYVGGLVGRNTGTIKNCISKGIVHGSESLAGGLVGRSYEKGQIINCISIADITGDGLVGNLEGTISGCGFGGTLKNSYSCVFTNLMGPFSKILAISNPDNLQRHKPILSQTEGSYLNWLSIEKPYVITALFDSYTIEVEEGEIHTLDIALYPDGAIIPPYRLEILDKFVASASPNAKKLEIKGIKEGKTKATLQFDIPSIWETGDSQAPKLYPITVSCDITVVKSSTPSEASSNGGGCSAGFSPISLLLLIPLGTLLKK